MSEERSLVLVQMGRRPCAIPSEDIVEIVPRVRLTPVPDAPPQVLGVINLRGKVVPVLDVRARVSGAGAMPEHQHLVIVKAGLRSVGLAVDEVSDVRTVPAAAVETPGELAGVRGLGVVRIDDDLVLVVRPEDVLHASG